MRRDDVAAAGRVVIITGASKGIGLAAAEQFAARGDRVVLVARSVGELEDAVTGIRSAGGQAWAWPGDATSSVANDELVAWVEAHVGPPEICVLNAGLSYWKPIVETSDDEWRSTMALNLDAVFFGTRSLLPGMVERRRGHFVFISSALAGKGAKNFSAYAASKAAVASFADSVSAEGKRFGIKSTVIFPGSTVTTMRKDHAGRPQTPDIDDPELQLGVEDVADAVLWVTGVSDRVYPTQLHMDPKGHIPQA